MFRWPMAAVVLVLLGKAQAGAITGNELFALCKDTNGVGQVRCLEYIHGVSDMMVVMRYGEAGLNVPCFPETVDLFQRRDIVVRWLEEHPETRHEPALGEIWLAFLDVFPCE